MSGGWGLWRTADWVSFQQQFDAWSSGVKLLDFDIHASGGTRFFTGTWGGAPTNQVLVHDLDWNAFTAKWKQLSDSGMRLTKVQVYPSAGPDLWTGLFEAGSGGYAFEATSDWNQFQTTNNNYKAAMQLVDFQVYDDAQAVRWYVGVLRETAAAHQFVVGLDWGSFVNQWSTLSGEGLRLQRVVRYPNPVLAPEPQWAQVFAQALDGKAMGYAYKVAKNGTVVAQGAKGLARASQDAPAVPWSLDVRINLASVSKAVTAVAVCKLLGTKHHSVDDKFYPYIQAKVPAVAAGVQQVTIRNLLTMKSGLVVDGSLSGDLWPFLNTYLQQPLVGTPGVTYAYSNTNFTILQGLIEQLSGQDYVTYVTNHVLKPMGINPAEFSPAPATQSLDYSGATDTRHGQAWGTFTFVAPGGWVTSANELFKFIVGVRNDTVLGHEATLKMLNGDLGWYTYDGIYGQYFHHNGGLLNGASPAQGVVTGIIRLSDGYDALLLVNSWGFDTIGLMIQAFQTR
jgi:CubicO group peptidase (beta-lactamase class C family)